MDPGLVPAIETTIHGRDPNLGLFSAANIALSGTLEPGAE
jgi:hypothetical protein